MLWALLRPVSRDAWGHGRQTLSALEKLPQEKCHKQGEEEEGALSASE